MAKTECKYQSYKELAAAFASGELDPKQYVLMLDNDNCYLRDNTPGIDEDAANEYCETLFDGNGYYDLEEVVTALGIPCESV